MNKWDLENALSGVDPRLTEEAAPEKTACPRAAAAVPKAETAEKRFLPRLIRAAKEMFARHKKLRIAVPLALLLALALILENTLHVRPDTRRIRAVELLRTSILRRCGTRWAAAGIWRTFSRKA